MPVGVRRREKESVQSLLRRFSKRILQSGVLVRARRSRFYIPPKTKRQRKVSSLRRYQIQKERERLYKLGKLENESR